MRKFMRNTMSFLSVLMIIMFVFTLKSHAIFRKKLELKVNTVIDNIDELPNSVRNKTFHYGAKRITNMTRTNNLALYPNQADAQSFTWKHGDSRTLSFNDPSRLSYNLLWFGSNSNTESNISLEKVVCNSNLKTYTYNDGGRAKAITPYNWLQIINDNVKNAEVTLHFKYNPDIDEIPMEEPDIHPRYSKKVDYLGNKESEAGSATDKVNYYRLYLDFNPGEDWRKKDNERDIIFVLDVSTSMEEKLGRSTRFKVLKDTLSMAINRLATNEKNKISIVTFGTRANTLITGENDKGKLLKIVNNLTLPGGDAGGTNFYEAMEHAERIINSDPTSEREKVVFFISDGEPTAAQPGANAIGYDYYSEVATAYAYEAGKNFKGTDSFFSIFIGDNTGSASTLQTFSQMVDVTHEKYTVQAADQAQLENAINRFMAGIDITFNDVTITDKLSKYADYAKELKVHRTRDNGDREELKPGTDYKILSDDSDTVSVKFLGDIRPETNYEISFDIKASDEAIIEYEETGIYPHIGDPDTDYAGNTTSSGRKGFYSNDVAELSYNFGSKDTITKKYPKPVIQIYDFNPVGAKIEFEKNLAGKDLIGDEFEFILSEVIEDGEVEKTIPVATAKNDGEGTIDFGFIKFSKPGRHVFEVKEVIPENKEPGYTYDDRTLRVIVDVLRLEDKDILKPDVRYIEGTRFLNRYAAEPVSVNFELQKEMIGRGISAGDFQFRLFDGNMKEIETVYNKADGKIIFSDVEFLKPSKYKFIVKEIVPKPQDPNIKYDLNPAYIDVDVVDTDGILKADVNYLNKTKFTNTFSRDSGRPVDADFKFNVILSGAQLSKGMFEFELRDRKGNTYKAKNEANGDIKFRVNFSNMDIGTHEFKAKQIIPAKAIQYMNYDKKEKTVRVDVSDNGRGGITINVSYLSDNTFYNNYKTSGRIW